MRISSKSANKLGKVRICSKKSEKVRKICKTKPDLSWWLRRVRLSILELPDWWCRRARHLWQPEDEMRLRKDFFILNKQLAKTENSWKVQSNSVITNSMGTSICVRYNRDRYIRIGLYNHFWVTFDQLWSDQRFFVGSWVILKNWLEL